MTVYVRLETIKTFIFTEQCVDITVHSGRDRVNNKHLKALANVLRTNKTIQSLTIKECGLDDKNVAILANGLENVVSLDISKNEFQDEGMIALANALAKNTVLQTLNISENHFGDVGMAALAEAAKTNKSLTTLLCNDMWSTLSAKLMLTNSSTLRTFSMNINYHLKDTDLGLVFGAITKLTHFTSRGGYMCLDSYSALATVLANNPPLVSLDITNTTIAPVGIVTIANTLETNSTLQSLNISDIKSINIDCVCAIADALKVNHTLRTLDISWIGERTRVNDEVDNWHYEVQGGLCEGGISALADALAVNKGLHTLDLSNNHCRSVSHLTRALEKNNVLQSLILEHNEIGDDGAIAFASAIETNTTLQSLNIKYNRIGNTGVSALAKALNINNTLQSLYLSSNMFDDVACFGYTLQVNNTLQSLDLSGCNPNLTSVRILAESLSNNKSLQKLYISSYADGMEECQIAFATALRSNDTLKVLTCASYGDVPDEVIHAFVKTLETNTTLQKLRIRIVDYPRDDKIDEYLDRNKNWASGEVDTKPACQS